MKKLISKLVGGFLAFAIMVAAIMAVSCGDAYAAGNDSSGMFYATGATGVTAFAAIKPINGKVFVESGNYSIGGSVSGTLIKYPFSLKTKAVGAGSSSTNLVIYTDDTQTNGAVSKLNGHTLAAGDFLAIGNATSGWQLRTVVTAGVTANDGQATMVVAAASWATNDVVYVCKAAEAVSQTVTADAANVPSFAVGNYNMPLGISIVSTSTVNQISGVWRSL